MASRHRYLRKGPCILLVVVLLLLQLFALASSTPERNEWTQMSPNVAFQRRIDETDPQRTMKMEGAMEEAMQRMLGSNTAYANTYQRTGEEWSSYQLAWRLLGFYIDCNANNNNNNNNNQHRSLKDDKDGGNQQCQRMVMYGVYVDLDYEGGGFDEYEYYDQSSGKFVCYSSYNRGCRTKMDCHLSDTNWKLLGVFKIAGINQGDGWMEQLFKHEGVCVWGEDTYKFASQMREKLPNACKATNVEDNNGNTIYYDVKPDKNATITVGLYSDYMCSIEYLGSDLNVFDVTGVSEENINQFNSDLATWKICQPCIAYSVSNAYYDYYCYDEAGYENCNQCMKFSAKSGCQIASLRDVTLADRQQTLLPFPMYGTMVGGKNSNRVSATSSSLATAASVTQGGIPFLKFSSLFFGVCFVMFLASSLRCKVVKRKQRKSKKGALLSDDDHDGLMRDLQHSANKKQQKSPKGVRGFFGRKAASSEPVAAATASKKKAVTPPRASKKETESPVDSIPKSQSKNGEPESIPRSNSNKDTAIPMTQSGSLSVKAEPNEAVAATDDATLATSGEKKEDDSLRGGYVDVDVAEESPPPETAETGVLGAISRSWSSLVGSKEDGNDDKTEPILDVEDRLPEVETTARETKTSNAEPSSSEPSNSSGWMKSRVFKLFKPKRVHLKPQY